MRANARGPWQWLDELVAQNCSPAVLDDALSCLGWTDGELIDAVTHVVGISAQEFRDPTAARLSRISAPKFALLLPRLFGHPSPDIRDIAVRWLGHPATVYLVGRSALCSWMLREPKLSRWLLPRFTQEALAWVGPDGVAHIAHHSADALVRHAAQQWSERLVERTAE